MPSLSDLPLGTLRATKRPAFDSVAGGTSHQSFCARSWRRFCLDFDGLSVRSSLDILAPKAPSELIAALVLLQLVGPLVGFGAANRSRSDRMYAGSARTTGSPSFMKEWKRHLRSRGSVFGFCNGNRLTGGAPKVTQCTRLKQAVSMLSSEWTVDESM